MWFLKSKKALQKELSVVLHKGCEIVEGYLDDYGDIIGENAKSDLNSLIDQMTELDNGIGEHYENYSRKQLYLFIKMFQLLLKTKRYEVAILSTVFRA